MLLWLPSPGGQEESGAPCLTNLMCPGPAQGRHNRLVPPLPVCVSEWVEMGSGEETMGTGIWEGSSQGEKEPSAQILSFFLGTQKLGLNVECLPHTSGLSYFSASM